ncbi:ABC transporter ATP-binding protein [[Mycoplasma] gypis]|uniref:ABC transporter ATP-binding protein n=2 Tax=[Mycoplasma] gypis TaxID=92404 RepID=A0ABZ2RVR9_9BACT|nr:ABC transporter ATP-binding protein [[Mycoplasma] gypis]MBN0919492.1 ABC transporter ATP-binding protein [[Mycoplasma] gypis]
MIVEIKNLSKSYDKKSSAIKSLNFNIEDGKFHAFIGSNGSGKTTTIKSIVGAYANFNGEILIRGHSNQEAIAKKYISYMPENPNFPKELNLYKYIYSLGLLSGLNKKDIETKTNEILQTLKIDKYKNKKPLNFSSGEKRKALLAQCLISNPDLLIMDEPAANLDPQARQELFSILNSFVQNGKSVFISTHELNEVNKFVNYVTIIEKGTIIYSGDFNSKDNLENFYFQKIKEYYEQKNN